MTSPSTRILERILTEARQASLKNEKFLACFDLDSTLFDLTFRVEAIVEAFARDADSLKRFPEECRRLDAIKFERTDWGIGEALDRLGLTEKKHPEFCHELHKYWASWFFSDHYLHHDDPLPGSVDYVRQLEKFGADIMYLTGRDAPRMKVGTEKSLLDSGFPFGTPKAKLILKPVAALDDAAFKVTILKEASHHYSKVWLFENEPVNLNLVAKMCPEIGLVFIDSTHSGREQVNETLDRIQHFETDLAAFETFKK